MPVTWADLFGELRFIAAAGVLLIGLIIGYVIGKANKQILIAAGVPDAVEGTPFERTAQSLGTSTVTLVARLSSWFIYGVSVLIALHIANLLDTRLFWGRITGFLPDLFVAILVFIIGFVIADKAELIVGERLRSVKVPAIGVIPRIVKYSIVYITALIALSQIGVATMALIVLLGAYAFALVFLGGIAFKDMLASGSSGLYLLLNQPYGIGDEIRVGDRRGVVQEVDVFVTHIENEEEEFIIPNRHVFQTGIVRLRN